MITKVVPKATVIFLFLTWNCKVKEVVLLVYIAIPIENSSDIQYKNYPVQNDIVLSNISSWQCSAHLTSHTIKISIYLSKITITRRAKYVLDFPQCYGSTAVLLSLTQTEVTKLIFHNSSKAEKFCPLIETMQTFSGFLPLFLGKNYFFFLSKAFWLLRTIRGYTWISTSQCRAEEGNRCEETAREAALIYKD